MSLGIELIRRLAKTKVCGLEDLFSIDRVRHRQPHLLVVKRRINDVEFDRSARRVAGFNRPDPFELSVADFLDPFVGRALCHVDIARLQRSETDRGVGNYSQDNTVDKGLMPPIVVKPVENNPLLRLPLDKLERACAGRKPRGIAHSLDYGLPGDHGKGLDSGKRVSEAGGRALHVDIERVAIASLDAIDDL